MISVRLFTLTVKMMFCCVASQRQDVVTLWEFFLLSHKVRTTDRPLKSLADLVIDTSCLEATFDK